MDCPVCFGTSYVGGRTPGPYSYPEPPDCSDCKGTGIMTAKQALRFLREFAKEFPDHIIVVADEIQSNTPSNQSPWRHPEDVEAIETAYMESCYWRDEIACIQALESRISKDRQIYLREEVRNQQIRESGESYLGDGGSITITGGTATGNTGGNIVITAGVGGVRFP